MKKCEREEEKGKKRLSREIEEKKSKREIVRMILLLDEKTEK